MPSRQGQSLDDRDGDSSPRTKDLLDLLLSRWGTLRTEVPVPATDAQRADVSFVPRAELPAALGLLACLGAVPCLFELFSQAPSREELIACQRKLLQWRHTLRKRDRDAEPACWLLCAARPDLALRSLGFTADVETPGIYRNAYGLGVIVLDELPHTRDTVLLRLLGRDATREGALDELTSVPLAPAALDEVVGLFVHYATLSAPSEDPTMAVDLSRYYAWKEQQRAEGRIEGEARGRLVGRLEGRLEGEADGRLLGGIEARLRRVLSDEELTRFRRRVARDGRDAVRQRALALDDRELARWVAGKRVRSN